MPNITNHQENANQNHNEIYYLIFVDSAVIKKNVNNKYKQECGEKRTLMYCWWETVWRFLKKLKIKLPCVRAKSLQLCSTLCDPMDWSLAGSSVHWILQERILEWVAISYTRGSFWLLDQAHVSCHLHWHQGSLALALPGKTRTTIWLSNFNLGIYKKKTLKALIQKHTCTPILTVALFTIVKICKQLTCPSTDEWIKKMWHIYT